MSGPYMESRTKVCAWCTAPYETTARRSEYCDDCVPKSEGRRWRQAITLYGVDKQMFDAMYFDQDGACLICREREATHIDHCHKTGKARGLLCAGCNTLLGFIEIPDRLDSALDYLAGELV